MQLQEAEIMLVAKTQMQILQTKKRQPIFKYFSFFSLTKNTFLSAT